MTETLAQRLLKKPNKLSVQVIASFAEKPHDTDELDRYVAAANELKVVPWEDFTVSNCLEKFKETFDKPCSVPRASKPHRLFTLPREERRVNTEQAMEHYYTLTLWAEVNRLLRSIEDKEGTVTVVFPCLEYEHKTADPESEPLIYSPDRACLRGKEGRTDLVDLDVIVEGTSDTAALFCAETKLHTAVDYSDRPDLAKSLLDTTVGRFTFADVGEVMWYSHCLRTRFAILVDDKGMLFLQFRYDPAPASRNNGGPANGAASPPRSRGSGPDRAFWLGVGSWSVAYKQVDFKASYDEGELNPGFAVISMALLARDLQARRNLATGMEFASME